MNESLTRPSEASLTLTQQPVVQMIQAVIDKGITSDNVAALTALTDLYERIQDKDSEKQFTAAFVALQADMPRIEAVKPVPNNDGSIRYKFAPYEEIMDKVRPVLQQHGFAVTFSSEFKESRVVQFCTLQHIGGHKRTNQFAVRVGKGPPGSSEAQGDGAASTYAKRFALCDALNIVIESEATDVDARIEGAPVTAEQVANLRKWVKDTASDEEKFLKFAGAKTYEEIPASRYSSLLANLHKKGAK